MIGWKASIRNSTIGDGETTTLHVLQWFRIGPFRRTISFSIPANELRSQSLKQERPSLFRSNCDTHIVVVVLHQFIAFYPDIQGRHRLGHAHRFA